MDGNIIELCISDALQSTFNELASEIKLENYAFTKLALCGYVKHVEVINDLTIMQIDDSTSTITAKIWCQQEHPEVENFLQQQISLLEDKLSGKRPLDFHDFEIPVMRFITTMESLPYSRNLMIGDLILITGTFEMDKFKNCRILKADKFVKIMQNQEDYLGKWLKRCEQWKCKNIKT